MNILTAVAGIALIVTVLALAFAWPVMLLWGAIAGTYGLPTMGFGTAVQVTWLCALLFKSSSSSSN